MSKQATIIQLGTDQVIMVELANRNTGLEVIRYRVQNCPADGVSAPWLRSVWVEAGFTQNQVICALPGSLVRFKSVIIPNLPPEQWLTAVRMELESGGNRSDIIKIIGWQPHEQMIQVKAVQIKNDDLAQHLKLFRDAGLKVIWSGVRTRGIQNFINFNQDFLSSELQVAVYLDLTEDKTEFGVINGAEIGYRRDFTPGATELSVGGAEAFNDLIQEVRLSIASFSAGSGIQLPSKVWVFGKGENLAHCEPVLFNHMDVQATLPVNSRLLGTLIPERLIPEVAPLIGLALDQFGFFNQAGWPIYSSEQATAQLHQKHLLVFGKAALAIVLLLGGALLTLQAGVEKNTKVQNWLRAKAGILTKLQRTEAQTNDDLRKVRELEKWLAERGCELEFLRIFQANLPEGSKIADLTIEEGIVKDISGITPSVSVMLNRFSKVPGLNKLKLKGTISISDDGEQFHLEGPILQKEPNQ